MQDVRVLSCFVQTLEQSIPGFVKSPGSPTSYSAVFLLLVWVLANLKGTSVHAWTLHVSWRQPDS